MPRPAPPRLTPVGDTDPFRPTARLPVRLRSRTMPVDTHFVPHSHPWSQLAYCASGLLQVTTARTRGAGEEATYIVPPSRAVWIAPGTRHTIHVLEEAQFRTLYIHASATPQGWDACRIIVVSPLLRELVQALEPALATQLPPRRQALLSELVLDEIARAGPQALGVPLPPNDTGDKRLRAFCEAVLRAPGQRTTLARGAAAVGASERTMARLFQEQLGMTYPRWRQQVVLAHALPLLARGRPVSQVARASGYASESAFTAMFRDAMGEPPGRFQRSGRE